ncbi:hypothetical protein GC093_12085 [Paenibacillus sp. LMG 31456]|uniref:Uncharacterized protein n=1 Tax=Paenibacillus foliorum TaxID=2654974 RepID=A0A972JZT9_9BACL|nr:hypothetical protein [Paenibacillus foliorum]NOU93951.1 hypothetical protein [Paenibacillus foliorum]
MRLNNKTKRQIVFIAFCAPIVINILILMPSFGLAASADWLSFFGNYSGGIIGGIVAFIIANEQIKSQNEKTESYEKETNRSYIVAEKVEAPILLHNTDKGRNKRILSTKKADLIYQQLENILSVDNNSELIKNTTIPFIKIRHYGTPEIILDCKIEFLLKPKNDPNVNRFNYNFGVIDKNTTLYIPLIRGENLDNIVKLDELLKFEITYTSIKGEDMKYKLEDDKEIYVYLDKEGKEHKVFTFKNESAAKWYDINFTAE